MNRLSPDEPPLIETFRGLIAQKLGLNFHQDQDNLLAEALACGARRTRQDKLDYLHSLWDNGEELQTLAQELTVGETSFFRHHQQMEAFLHEALPQQRRRKGGRPLTILSAGCSSGEEPYSLAMLALHYGLGAQDVKIIAADINSASLKKARNALYSRWSLRETSLEVRSRWFRQQGEMYVLDCSVAEMVEFRQANLLDPGLDLWPSQHYDIIFCRNVVMYFQHESTVTLMANFAKALAKGGYLFLGHAESLRGISESFQLLNTHQCFYYQKVSDSTPTPSVMPDWSHPLDRPIVQARHPDRDPPSTPCCEPTLSNLDDIRDLQEQELYAEAWEAFQQLPPSLASQPEAQLLNAILFLHLGRSGDAERLCQDLLHHSGYAPGAHFLRALCHQESGQVVKAVTEHHAATRLDPTFAFPQLQLGLLARRAHDPAKARKALEKALVLLHNEKPQRLRLFGGGFGREALVNLTLSEIAACQGRRRP